MRKLRKIKFKEFIKLQRGFDLPKKDMVDGPYPVMGSTSIIGYHKEYKQKPPGVITGRSGSLGKLQYINKKYWPHNTSLWIKDFKGNKITEKLTEEELALFDKLKKSELSEKDKKQVKKVAKELLHKLNHDGLSAVDWRKKQQIKASVKREIEIELDSLPKTYTQQDYEIKCVVAFQHFYDNYFGDGKSVYAAVY